MCLVSGSLSQAWRQLVIWSNHASPLYHPSVYLLRHEHSLIHRVSVSDDNSCHASPSKGQNDKSPSSASPRSACPDNSNPKFDATTQRDSAIGGRAEFAMGKQKQAEDISDEVIAGTNWRWHTIIRRVVVASHQLSATQAFSQTLCSGRLNVCSDELPLIVLKNRCQVE